MSYSWITKQEAEKKLKEYWFNQLKAKKKNPWWKLLLQQKKRGCRVERKGGEQRWAIIL